MEKSADNTNAVELRDLTKVFGEVRANDGIHLKVRNASIHGVIGENGAGKSTAMKMLYGLYTPDSGTMIVNGKARSWASPSEAIAAGIGMVHQHFMLAGPYTALDNILLGAEPSLPGFDPLPQAFRAIDRERAKKKLEAIAKQYALPVDWDAPVETLAVGIQQRIEIIKLLYRDAQILVLDEPTAVLTPQEITELFENLKKLKSEGKTILIITHKLKEVMSLTDRVTVFRRGKVTGEVDTAETDEGGLAELMVGRKVTLRVDVPPQPPLGKPVVELKDVTLPREGGGKPLLSDVSLQVCAGEVVGIAGVEGNGQSQLIKAILSPRDAFKAAKAVGSISVLGADATHLSTQAVKEKGVGFIPEDRHAEALLLESPVYENFLLGLHRRFQKKKWGLGLIDKAELMNRVSKAIKKYDVRPVDPQVKAGGLSGGNQQKLIIAREFESSPQFLIAAQPTRGVDVGAIEFIHNRILEARTEGAGVLLVSSELDEVMALSDRVLVMYEGAIVAEFKRGECDEKSLGMHMGGAGHA